MWCKGREFDPSPWRSSFVITQSCPKSSLYWQGKAFVLTSPTEKHFPYSISFQTLTESLVARRQEEWAGWCNPPPEWKMAKLKRICPHPHLLSKKGFRTQSMIYIANTSVQLTSTHLCRSRSPNYRRAPWIWIPGRHYPSGVISKNSRPTPRQLLVDTFDPQPTLGWDFPRVTLSSGHLLSWPSVAHALSRA